MTKKLIKRKLAITKTAILKMKTDLAKAVLETNKHSNLLTVETTKPVAPGSKCGRPKKQAGRNAESSDALQHSGGMK